MKDHHKKAYFPSIVLRRFVQGGFHYNCLKILNRNSRMWSCYWSNLPQAQYCNNCNYFKQHAIYADLVPFSLTLGCSKYELRYWNQYNIYRWDFSHITYNDQSNTNHIDLEIWFFLNFPMTRAVLGVRQFLWHEQFHGTSWNLDCGNFAGTGSSVEFHGIPCNLECDNFNDMSSSMQFHKTWGASISLTRPVPWYSMELALRQFRWHEQFKGIPWNSVEHGVRQLNGIPWNLSCLPISMTEAVPYGTWIAQVLLTLAVPWNSMEFHGRWTMPVSMTRAILSTEFHGTSLVIQFRWHEQFHGITCKLDWVNFDDKSIFMEFYET